MTDEPKADPRDFQLSMRIRDAVRAEMAQIRQEQEPPPSFNPIEETYLESRARRTPPTKPRDVPMIIVAVLAVCVTLLLAVTIAAMAYVGAPVNQFVDLVKWAMLSVAIPAGAAILKRGQEK